MLLDMIVLGVFLLSGLHNVMVFIILLVTFLVTLGRVSPDTP